MSPLTISWYGQAMFRIADGERAVVVDPTAPETGYSFEPFRADVVLVTHQHFDHNYLGGITGNPEVVESGGESEVAGMLVRGFDSFHDSEAGSLRGPNVIYAWEQAGLRLVHFGDLGEPAGNDVIEEVRGADIAMIPAGGVFTIDPGQAVELVKKIEPRVVFPMHYLTPDCKVGVQPVDGFTAGFGGTVRHLDARPVEVSAGNLPASTEVWVLPYR